MVPHLNRNVLQVDAVKNLRHVWRGWSAMVSTVIRSRRTTAVAPEEYTTVRQAVLSACRRCRKEIKGPSREFFRYAEDLVRPWVSIEAIRGANREIRADLLTQCQRVGLRLAGKRTERNWVRLGLIVALAAIGGVSLAVLTWAATRRGDVAMTIERLRHSAYRLAVGIEQASIEQKVGAGTVVMLIIGFWMMYALRRD